MYRLGFDRRGMKKKKTKKTTLVQKQHRPWANLPSTALLTIFRRTGFKQRFRTIPLVCKSWRWVSEHPQCWSSMIPDSVPPEKAFIKECRTFLITYNIKLDDQLAVGVSRLETLIKKSGGGDAIASLYLSPFISSYHVGSTDTYGRYRYQTITNTDRVLRLIADCCPNLKHISFLHCRNGFAEEHILELINKCRKLELIDFDYLRCVQSSSLIQKLGNFLPHLRGLRIHSSDWNSSSELREHSSDLDLDWNSRHWSFHFSCPIAHDIAKYLPRLKLLNLARSFVNDDELSSILSGCLELQYLNVMHRYDVSGTFKDDANAKIPEFYFSRKCCSTCRASDVADLSDFDQEEYGKQESKEYDLFAGFCDETGMSYDYEYYLLKDERSKAFYRGRAKDRKRRQFRALYGRPGKFDERQSKLKPLVECKMPYANDLYVMPVCK